MSRTADIAELIGKKIQSVEEHEDYIIFGTDGGGFKMYHEQDCCENVQVESIDGDLQRLVGQVIIEAREESNVDWKTPEYPDSWTWTFYILRSNLDSVTIRWLGESNGYYSESVDFVNVDE